MSDPASQSPELPNHAYYRPLHGRWRSPFQFEVTHWGAFWACPMGLMDRLRVLSMTAAPRLFGPLTIETEVDYATRGAQGEVIHKTRITKWGATFLRSDETFSLHKNGRDLAVRGEQRLWPTPWRVQEFVGGHASIDESGTRATYVLPLLGTQMRQTTQVEQDGVRITQETEWSRGVQMLRRF